MSRLTARFVCALVVVASALLGPVTAIAADARTETAASQTAFSGAAYGDAGSNHRTPISERGGYVVAGVVGDHSLVVGSWTISDVECLGAPDSYSPYVGLDAATARRSKQVGVRTDCATGQPRHRAWFQVPGTSRMYLRGKVFTGDVVTASVRSSSDIVTLTLDDVTQGWSRSTSDSVAPAISRAESVVAVIASPADHYPLIPSVAFTNVEIDGEPLGGFGAERYRTGTFDGQTLYAPTRLSHGADFTIEQRTR